MVKIVGRDALPAAQRLILVCADVAVEALLRQSAFSEIDRYCSPEKQSAMLTLIGFFIQRAEEVVNSGVDPDLLLTLPVVRRLQRMGEDIPNERLADFDKLQEDLDDAIAAVMPSAPNQAA